MIEKTVDQAVGSHVGVGLGRQRRAHQRVGVHAGIRACDAPSAAGPGTLDRIRREVSARSDRPGPASVSIADEHGSREIQRLGGKESSRGWLTVATAGRLERSLYGNGDGTTLDGDIQACSVTDPTC